MSYSNHYDSRTQFYQQMAGMNLANSNGQAQMQPEGNTAVMSKHFNPNINQPNPNSQLSSGMQNTSPHSNLEYQGMNPAINTVQNIHPPQPGMNMRPPQPGMNMRPPQPGMNMRPPQPGMNTRPPQPGMSMGPPQPGTSMGPPQPGMSMGPPQPGMSMRPPQPGMSMGLQAPSQGGATAITSIRPAMSTGPTGMGISPSSSGMGMRPPSGMGPPSSGMGMGPPSSGMGMGPQSSGMGMGPPSSGMGMGPPSSGMGMGPPSSGMGMGPPSSGMGMGPPSSGMGMGPPSSGMGMGPPSSGMGMGPQSSGMGMGPPSSGMGMGPPSSGMGMGPPSSGMGMGPPSSGMGMGPQSSGMGMGPQSSGMGMGPQSSGMGMGPQSSGMGMGPPSSGMGMGRMGMGSSSGPPSSGMGMGPPSSGMGMGPPSSGIDPSSSGMGMGPPSSGMGMGPLSSSMGMGPPSGMGMGPPSSSMGMGPPSVGPGGMVPGMGRGVGHMQGRGMGSSVGMATSPNMGGTIHSQPTSQQAPKINPDMMPNPIALMRDNKEKFGGQVYHTSNSSAGITPPLVTTSFNVQDNGNCSPRYMRSTLYAVPCNKDLINQCKIPLGVVIQPFASIPISENTLTVVDHGASGPLRCNRCKAYMNPYCRFIDGGRHYVCPICQCSNEVSHEFFCHLDHTGNRTDITNRPELLYGSVEYIATKDYCKEGSLPLPPAYIFMIDVSVNNIQSGMVSLLSQTMLSILCNLPKDSNGVPIKVGFVTYDRVLHFYNLKECLTQPQMMVVSDINDVFVPLVDGFLVDIEESKQLIDNLMAQIPDVFANNKTSSVILEPVIKAGLESLKAAKRNGRLFIFHSNLPTANGPGQLNNRQDSKLLGTDKEKTLLSSVGGPYTKLAQECVKYGVGVELFVFPNDYCDMATLSILAHTTGGEIHLYPKLQTASDGERLIADIVKSVSRETGFDCVMRVRCSAGIRAVNYYGGFYMANTTDIELGNIDTDKAMAIEIKHDDKMKDDMPAYIQAALLYTSVSGERRLRVHNMALKCSNKFSDIYQSCELDTIISFICKSVCSAAYSMPYKCIRETLTTQCSVILSCYRKQCSKQSPPGQLILPDSLKLLPLYAGCLLKSDALLSPPIVTIDEKSYQMHKLLTMDIKQTVSYLYPRLINLEPIIDGTGSPEIVRCTGQKVTDAGMYLITNGLVMVLWVGQNVTNAILLDSLGVSTHSQVNTNLHSLPALDNETSFRLRGLVKDLNEEHQQQLKFIVAKQRDKSEIMFRRLLKEDKGSGPWEGVSYIDYLCQIHKEIREILS